MRALRALKLIASLGRAMPSLTLTTSTILSFYLKYLYKKRAARKEAFRMLKSYGLPEDVAEELLEVLVPDVGGPGEWVNLMKSGSCC